MRISDWSSDVCSSDLAPQYGDVPAGRGRFHPRRRRQQGQGCRDCRAQGRNRRVESRTRQKEIIGVLSHPTEQKTGQMTKHALSVTRQADFAAWYQDVVAEADLAEQSGVRGCMVIKPWRYGIRERTQTVIDPAIQDPAVQHCSFPLILPYK